MDARIITRLLVLSAMLGSSSFGARGDWVRELEEAARNQAPPLTLKDLLDLADAERESKDQIETLEGDVAEPSPESRDSGIYSTPATPISSDEVLRVTVDRDEGPFLPTTVPTGPSVDRGTFTATVTVTAPPVIQREIVTVTIPGEMRTVFAPPATAWATHTVVVPPETHRETVTLTSPPHTERETVIITAPPNTVFATMTVTDTPTTQTHTQTIEKWQTATVLQTATPVTKTVISTEVREPVTRIITAPPQTMTATATVHVIPKTEPRLDSTAKLIRDEAEYISRTINDWFDIVEPLLYAVCVCCCWLVIVATAHLFIIVCHMRRNQAPNVPPANVGGSPARPSSIIRRRPGVPESIEMRRIRVN